MRVKKLQPIKENPLYYNVIENAILKMFRKELYVPLVKDLGLNNNLISNNLSVEALKKVLDFLSKVIPYSFVGKLKLEDLFFNLTTHVDRKFIESVKDVSVQPELSNEVKERLATSYTQSLKLPIKDFLQKEIIELRKKIEAHITAGGRHEELAKIIQKSYRVSERKAKFLARQESSIFMAKFKRARYAEVGIDSYYWRCVKGTPAHPVRPMHRKLGDESNQGKVFSFSNPPVTNPQGNHNNPGEDYNCRCYAVPIVKF